MSKLDAAHSIIRRTGVPSGWYEGSLGDVVTFVSGGTPDRNESSYWRDGAIPWITPTDLTANGTKYVTQGAECISELGLQNSNTTLVPSGAIVFSSRGTVANIAIAGRPLTFNQSCEGLLTKSSKVISEFLYYLLNYGKSAFLRLACGTTFGSITRRDIATVRFAFPPICEQAAIAQVLGAVDRAIQGTQTAVERARDLDHSLLHGLLENGIAGRHGKGKPVWPIHPLDDVADVGSGVTLGKDLSGFKNVELPYLRVANVQDGHLDLSTIKTVRVRLTEVDNYRLEPGDVLMTEGGDIDKLGRGTIWHGEIPNCLHQNHIFRIRAKQDELRPYFFALVVESDIAKRYFLRVAKRTTNLASINKTVLRAFRFPVPDPTEQEEIENVMKAVKATVKTLSEKELALLALKKSVMHDLLTGAIRLKSSPSPIAEAV